jgi:hypothetical protein
VAAAADPTDAVGLSLGVFLLGLGWNLCWVGGSSLLSREGTAQVEGDVDAVVWTTSAFASLLSGALLATGGFALVVGVGGGVALAALVPLAVVRAIARSQTVHIKESDA